MMFREKHPFIISMFVVCLCLLIAASSFGAESYPLVCRGGGSMVAQYEDSPDYGLRLFIRFQKAPQPANTQALESGQCVWLDRVLGEGERNMLSFALDDTRLREVEVSESGVKILSFRGRHSETLKNLLDYVRQRNIFNLRVHRVTRSDGTNYMAIDRLGP